MSIHWLKAFELGIPEIDSDHRALVELAQKIEAAMAVRDWPRCESMIDHALLLAESHFRREEALLEKWGYPDTEGHSKFHRHLQQRGENIRRACALDNRSQSLEECYADLVSFIVDDVIRGDVKFKSFLQNEGMVQPPAQINRTG